jgi:acetyl esterase/lipase
MLRPALILLATLFTALAPAAAQFTPTELASDHQPPNLVWDTFRWGPERDDRIRYVANPLKGRPPVVVMIGGFGLSGEDRYDTGWIASFLHGRGWLPMWVGFKPEDDWSADEELAKLTAGIAGVVREAEKRGYDGTRIVLLGTGWGAGTAALLATDHSLLEKAGVPLASIRGVIALDPNGLDFAATVRDADRFRRKQLEEVLAGDPGAAARLSPLTHAAAPNAPMFLFHAIGQDSRRYGEAQALAEALRQAGSDARLRNVKRSGWRSWSTYAGHPANPDNESLATFLEAVKARP